MTKSTPLSVENALTSALHGYKEQAAAIRAAHVTARKAIQDDAMTSDLAKRGKLDGLKLDTRSKLDALKATQETFVQNLRDKVEKELRGDQPVDGASVVSRRDAADRARKLDRGEALEVLRDAVAGNDADFAHAIGVRARNLAWLDVAEAWKAAYPSTAGSAEALSIIDSMTTGPAANLSNSAVYASPLD